MWLVGILTVGLVVVAALRYQFVTHLDHLEVEVRLPASSRADLTGVRNDLPPEVMALAERVGARSNSVSTFVNFEQIGQMWQTPGGKPMDFTAQQTVSQDSPGYIWRARFAPFGLILGADYLVAGKGGLEVRLMGIIPVVHQVGGAEITQGEALRYLAELPWSPDAILINRALDWTVIDAKTLKVATGQGPARAEITFTLDDKGLVASASAPSRSYLDKGKMTNRPWQGRFWDYQTMNGRLIPRWGEVAWTLDSGNFIYWRAQIVIYQLTSQLPPNA